MSRKSALQPNTIEKIEKALSTRPDIVVDYTDVIRANGTQWLTVFCNKCGKSVLRNIKSITSGNFECRNCYGEKALIHIQESSFSLVSMENSVANIKCNNCSSCLSTPLQQIKEGRKIRCSGCTAMGYQVAAKSIGFEYLSYLKNTSNNIVQVKCQNGHEVTVRSSALLRQQVACNECRLESYKKALAKKDCAFVSIELVQGSTENKSRVTYTNTEGELFNNTVGNILQGSFATNKLHQWFSKHNTYLIRLEHNGVVYCKIGTAQDPSRRMRRLKLAGKSEVFVLAEFENRYDADNLESELHREFSAFRVSPVVANTFSGALIKVKYKNGGDNVIARDGVHEWFQESIFKILSKRYNLKE